MFFPGFDSLITVAKRIQKNITSSTLGTRLGATIYHVKHKTKLWLPASLISHGFFVVKLGCISHSSTGS